MSQIWLEKLEAAPSKVARDEILLREFRNLGQARACKTCGNFAYIDTAEGRALQEVEDQIRSLADLAFDRER